MIKFCKVCGKQLVKDPYPNDLFGYNCIHKHYNFQECHDGYVEVYFIDGFVIKNYNGEHMFIIINNYTLNKSRIDVPIFDINPNNIEQVKAKLNMIRLMQ